MKNFLSAIRKGLSGRGSRVYCSCFDSLYLAQGIAMLRSLRRYQPQAEIHVLAFDDLCAGILDEVFAGAVRVIRLETLHARFPGLRNLGDGRSRWASYATQKPAFARFTLENRPQPSSVTFIDADTWFFADPAPMYEEIAGASIALSPHRFTATTGHLAVYGEYNAGCIYWRGDETGRQSTADWERECLEWCEERLSGDGRFMNQGYLNRWPARYANVHVIRHPGVNLAPWNFDGCRIARGGAGITVNDLPLIFYHFSGIMRDAGRRWYSFYPHAGPQFELVHEAIYGPYLLTVTNESDRLRQAYGIDGVGSVRSLLIGPDATRLHPAKKSPYNQ